MGVEAAFPKPIPLRARRFWLWLVVLGLLTIAGTTYLMLSWRSAADVRSLPEEPRRALYERTLADLELCATTAREVLGNHCAHQAEFIRGFVECDANCRKLAAGTRGEPTR